MKWISWRIALILIRYHHVMRLRCLCYYRYLLYSHPMLGEVTPSCGIVQVADRLIGQEFMFPCSAMSTMVLWSRYSVACRCENHKPLDDGGVSKKSPVAISVLRCWTWVNKEACPVCMEHGLGCVHISLLLFFQRSTYLGPNVYTCFGGGAPHFRGSNCHLVLRVWMIYRH